ncbi:MAG: ribbon-helix-helix protein, CopG family, partial [Candidatus Nanohaloarchaea archaeon]|nr:ribbon-helix-helix protein, CopG family [Candidatus Nanohaloarchaea archaeon]
MPELTEQVDELAHEQGVSESEVLEEALEYGVKELWEKSVLAKYLRGETSREKAVELVGLEKVKRAEQEAEAVE